jgi:hypothetical protein
MKRRFLTWRDGVLFAMLVATLTRRGMTPTEADAMAHQLVNTPVRALLWRLR